MTKTTVPLAQATPDHGSKAANLAWLIKRGFRVPPGVVVDRPDADGLSTWISPSARYAVRSSASVEDTETFSFAGQFLSVLDVVGPEKVGAAVQSVLDSVHDERLRPYLQHTGIDPDEVRMHAVVQQMVPARVSGVAFSRNPVTGLADVLIEAAEGTGDALVSGVVTPERWVRHWGSWTERPDDSLAPETVMVQIADTVASIGDAWGAPVDIEWSWDGHDLYLLQVRPMTAANVPVYSSRLAKEFLPGVIPPLVWSINVPVVNSAWLSLFTSLVGPLDLEPEDLSRQFAYRAYFNMGAVGDIFEALRMPRDLLEVLLGIDGGDEKPGFRPDPAVARHLPRMLRMAARLAVYHRELDRTIPDLQNQFVEIESRDPLTLSDQALLDQLTRIEDLVRQVAFANIVTPLLFNAHGAVLRKRLARAGVDPHSVDFGAGHPALDRYDPTRALGDLAETVSDLDLATQERVFAGEIHLIPGGAAFLERFGHVSDSGNDFSHVPWRENPKLVGSLVADYVQRPSQRRSATTPPVRHSRPTAAIERRTARYRVERERVSYTYTRGYGLLRPIVLEAARRLVERGSLSRAEDVFYLERDELTAALQGSPASQLADEASRRRAEADRLADVEMPEVIFGDEFTPAPAVDRSNSLAGVPSSRGVYTGPARVSHGIGDSERVAAGDVVVIPYSDVGWTPMLARAGAIVAESGGLLSHSSIVAREFGIPCVVSVAGAMRIPDGSIVRVDGFTGDVHWKNE